MPVYGFNERSVAERLKEIARLTEGGGLNELITPNLLHYPMELTETLPAAVEGPPFVLGTASAYILDHNDSDDSLDRLLPDGSNTSTRVVYNMFTEEITADKRIFCVESYQGKLYVVAVLC